MKTTHVKSILTALAVMAALVVVSPAWAARDAGAKARGDYSSAFGARSRSMNYYRQSYARPQRASVSQESLSVEPLDYQRGDHITITADTPLRMGDKTVAQVSKGTDTKVLKINGRWIGVEVQHDGQPVRGWVTFHAVEHAAGHTSN